MTLRQREVRLSGMCIRRACEEEIQAMKRAERDSLAVANVPVQ